MILGLAPAPAPWQTGGMRGERKVCPECGHVFKGKGWDGIDAHWGAKHERVMPYKEAWPLIRSGSYKRSGSLTPRKPREGTSQIACRAMQQVIKTSENTH
jgi:hypothetical protein